MPTIPAPEVGLVIHFNYLWKREQDLGRNNARYPRPCAIIIAHRRAADGTVVVLVSPITHAAPATGTAPVEMPQAVKRHLGLDDERSWVVADEVNEFVWPGYDLQPNAKGEIAYGFIPDRLYQQVRVLVLEAVRAGGLGRVAR
ncbi:hypothetical protein BH11PSE2_BH11PSE2_21530 [soil metagenome]